MVRIVVTKKYLTVKVKIPKKINNCLRLFLHTPYFKRDLFLQYYYIFQFFCNKGEHRYLLMREIFYCRSKVSQLIIEIFTISKRRSLSFKKVFVRKKIYQFCLYKRNIVLRHFSKKKT